MQGEIRITIMYGHEDMDIRRKEIQVPVGTTMGELSYLLGSRLGLIDENNQGKWEKNGIEIREGAGYIASLDADIAETIDRLAGTIHFPLSYTDVYK